MKKFGKVLGEYHFAVSGIGFMALDLFRDGVTLLVSVIPVPAVCRLHLSGTPLSDWLRPPFFSIYRIS